jgi:hypothetical protein
MSGTVEGRVSGARPVNRSAQQMNVLQLRGWLKLARAVLRTRLARTKWPVLILGVFVCDIS